MRFFCQAIAMFRSIYHADPFGIPCLIEYRRNTVTNGGRKATFILNSFCKLALSLSVISALHGCASGLHERNKSDLFAEGLEILPKTVALTYMKSTFKERTVKIGYASVPPRLLGGHWSHAFKPNGDLQFGETTCIFHENEIEIPKGIITRQGGTITGVEISYIKVGYHELDMDAQSLWNISQVWLTRNADPQWDLQWAEPTGDEFAVCFMEMRDRRKLRKVGSALRTLGITGSKFAK